MPSRIRFCMVKVESPKQAFQTSRSSNSKSYKALNPNFTLNPQPILADPIACKV